MQPEGGVAPAYDAGYEFKLNDLPNYQEFTNLFDMYRINFVVMRFVPTATQVLVNSDANSEEAPLIYTAIDYNNADAPGSADVIKQYGNCRVNALNVPFTLKFRPRTATPVFRDGVSSAYLQNPARLWIDCSYADVPHYGVKVYVTSGNTRQVYRVRIELTYYLSFKNTK